MSTQVEQLTTNDTFWNWFWIS